METISRRCWCVALAVVVALVAVGVGRADETKAPDEAGGSPRFYGFCMELPGVKDPSVPKQAEMLREIGFDGVGYPLWLDENLEKNLKTLDEAGLELYLVYTSIDLNPKTPAYDPRVPEAIRKLKGRPTTICVLIRGFPAGDPKGMEPAVKVLRELGDVVGEAGLRVSIYHHTNDWTESMIHALEVVKKTNHPRVGVNFNLCHWLKVDGEKDYGPLLRENARRIFAVTINGAKLGSEAWANGLIQPLDRGDFDNRALLRLLRQIGYDGPVGLMCYGIPDDVREHLGRSMQVWKGWQAE